jgi:flagellar assembly protein FliH
MILRFDRADRNDAEGEVVDLMSRTVRDVSPILFDGAEPPELEPTVEVDLEEQEQAAAALELEARLEAARREGCAQARTGFEQELEARLAAERARVERVRVEFARDRQRFFAAAESQVVRLALAVARKILARDAVWEGMPLRSTVKAALARVQDGSETTLQVPEEEFENWSAMFQQNTSQRVNVVPVAGMQSGECVLRTSVGDVELAIETQLEEIERGFDELLQVQES